MYKSIVLIPALNPPAGFVEYVGELIETGFEHILVIDDGSDWEHKKYFDRIKEFSNVTVYTHIKNMGKGRALKNGLNYAMALWGNDDGVKGIITVDSDGQHTVEDVIKIHEALEGQENPALILGVRDFYGNDIPKKSSFGNKTTSKVFRLLYGKRISDTQTGLRGIPREYIGDYIDLKGERFEYEMNMLIYGAGNNHKIMEIPIRTIYINKNDETHFRPFADSFKIYRLVLGSFFRFIMSSLSASIIDLSLFKVFTVILASLSDNIQIIAATIAARVISAFYNFEMNKRGVFKSAGKVKPQAAKYLFLSVVQMLASAGIVVALNYIFGGSKLIEKIIADTVLFLISYQIQLRWVFKK